jgi:DeoR family transcriptional regulator of aga operon
VASHVEREGFARVEELGRLFGVSAVTVRSDLDVLEAEGRVRRIRGGALSQAQFPLEPSVEVSRQEAGAAKAAIARRAVREITNGDTLLLDVGSTTTAIAEQIVARPDLRDLTVFTSSLTIALELEKAADRLQIVVTGGTLRPLQHSLVDPLATSILEQVSTHAAFIGCNGVHPSRGVTNLNLPETRVKQAMLRAARRRIVVADGSKLGEVALAQVCPLADVDLLITDPGADPETVAALRECGVTVDLSLPSE